MPHLQIAVSKYSKSIAGVVKINQKKKTREERRAVLKYTKLPCQNIQRAMLVLYNLKTAGVWGRYEPTTFSGFDYKLKMGKDIIKLGAPSRV